MGRKTANVVLNTAFGQPTMAVRYSYFQSRQSYWFGKRKDPFSRRIGLLKNIEPEFLHDAHHWLILHGRYVCTARNPHCSTCLIQDLCEYKDKNL